MPDSTELSLSPALLDKLRARYAEPHRHYHSLAHVEALQRWFARYRTLAREPWVIDAAIRFHDAVYDTQRQDNEQRSAALAHDELTALAWPAASVQRVAGLVLATQRHQAEVSDTDSWLFLDLDLSVLGQSPARYAAYADAVRAEYGWVEASAYRAGRARVLRSFLERDRIYQTPVLHEAWERAARANLQNELASLTAPG
ncbi:MAG: N-methyl-D-aspartate receptor NMDAR2C subunit [Burkholderiaceae bacterium]